MTHIHFDADGQLIHKPEWDNFKTITDFKKYADELVEAHGEAMVLDYTEENMSTYEILATNIDQVYTLCVTLIKKVGWKKFDHIFVTKYEGDEKQTFRMVHNQDTNALEMYEV